MARKLVMFLLLVLLTVPTLVGFAQEPDGLPVDVPREDLWVFDQIFLADGQQFQCLAYRRFDTVPSCPDVGDILES